MAAARPKPTPSAGYSGTPLPQKLGIASGTSVLLDDEPAGFRDLLVPLPAQATFATRAAGEYAVIVLFTKARAHLSRRLPVLMKHLADKGGLWVAWPKKASGVKTDLTEDVRYEQSLDHGADWRLDNTVAVVTKINSIFSWNERFAR